MNRIVDLIRGQLAAYRDVTDRHLLDRFLAMRDEAAFAELVRRHGPVVWGVCRRRLANQHDAEDAFQATFLVLVRRAAGLSAKVPLGPWLHRVAVMTAGNVLRGNRRRAPVSQPMEHEVATPAVDSAADRFDLDAALLALPERDRVPVVLCHLQGLTRREAAERLGCAEGTLSARLHRALARLKERLGRRDAVVLAAVVPASLSTATVHAAIVDSTSTLTAAEISPAVAGLTDGVIRMFLLKKVAAGLAFAVLLTGGLLAGFAIRPGNAAQATVPMVSESETQPDDPEAAAKRLEKRLADLQKQKELLDVTLADLQAEKAKLDEAKRAKEAADAAAALGKDIAVVVENSPPGGQPTEYRIYEVVNGKITEVLCSDLDILTTYLQRTFNDPKGPKRLRVGADKNQSSTQLRDVLTACAVAGYKTASFSHDRPTGYFHRYPQLNDAVISYHALVAQRLEEKNPKPVDPLPNPGEIDLRQFGKPKK